MATAEEFLGVLTSQAGDRYVFGAEASPANEDPGAFDCSELVEWACGRLGVTPKMPDGSWIQARHVHNHSTSLDVEKAIWTPGALLFRFSSNPLSGSRPSSSHVAVSMGDGRTIEARGSRYGVGHFTARESDRGWTMAGLVPGLRYVTPPKLTWEEVAALALSTGLSTEQAEIATAIAFAESRFYPGVAGDTGITSNTWGASLGLWQIRSYWDHAGTGKPRDPEKLRVPAFNAWAMTVISNKGTKWAPWSVYNSGSYQQHMDQARQAVWAATAKESIPDLEPWAEKAWYKAEDRGLWSTSSKPDNVVTDQRLAVFLDRLGLLEE